MKCFLPLAALIMFSAMSHAAALRFYVGTYTNKPASKGIYTGVIDSETGKLGPVTLAGEAANPSFLALSPSGKFLYAAMEAATSSAAAFRVQPDGSLASLNSLPAPAGACHISTDHTGGNIFVAGYGGGSIACFHANPDGSLDKQTAFVQFSGSGPDPRRQTKPYAHSIYADPADRFVYSCDLGTDHVWIFKFDATTGTLPPNDPPAAKVPPGGGPRHLAFHPGGRFVYVNNEMGQSVTTFARDAATGALTPLQTLSSLPAGIHTTGMVTTSEIFCHPSGKWLYVSNRGHDSIATYAIAADGMLTWLDDAPSPVKMPRGFAIDPTGRWLIAAGQDDNKITVLKIDQDTGKLSPTGEFADVGIPVCVIFAPQK